MSAGGWWIIDRGEGLRILGGKPDATEYVAGPFLDRLDAEKVARNIERDRLVMRGVQIVGAALFIGGLFWILATVG